MWVSPLKILFVMRPATGGMFQQVAGLARGLDRDGFQPVMACPLDLRDALTAAVPGAAIHPLTIKGELGPPGDLRAAAAIARLARDEGVAVVHAQGLKAGLLCLWAAVSRPSPYSVICTLHNSLRRQAGGVFDRASRLLAAMVGKFVDHLVTVSGDLETEAIGLLHLAPEKITCIHNGIDPTPFENAAPAEGFREGLGIPSSALLVGTAARLIPQKGVAYLIRAASLLREDFPGLYFVVAGDGPCRGQLEAEVAAAGLGERFLFAGFRHDMPGVLAACDLFALPTLEEGCSITVLEAMSAGRPLVATTVNGMRELVTAEAGRLVPPGDPVALAGALHDLLALRPRWREMGQAGRGRVRKCFSLDKMVEDYSTLYTNLAGRFAVQGAVKPEPGRA